MSRGPQLKFIWRTYRREWSIGGFLMKTIGYALTALIAVVALILTISFTHGGVELFVNMLFIVGAIIVGIGGLTAAGISKPTFREWYGHSTRDPDKQVEIFLKYRRAQWKQGVLILIFGIALICLSVAMGTFLRL
jgi:hypothetical protein